MADAYKYYNTHEPQQHLLWRIRSDVWIQAVIISRCITVQNMASYLLNSAKVDLDLASTCF